MCWIPLIVALNRWGITRLTALARAHILGLSNLPGLHCLPPSLHLPLVLSPALAYTLTFTFNSLTSFCLYLSLSLTVSTPFFLSIHPSFSISWLCAWAKSRLLILILPECLKARGRRKRKRNKDSQERQTCQPCHSVWLELVFCFPGPVCAVAPDWKSTYALSIMCFCGSPSFTQQPCQQSHAVLNCKPPLIGNHCIAYD